jgi:hypothetical protein
MPYCLSLYSPLVSKGTTGHFLEEMAVNLRLQQVLKQMMLQQLRMTAMPTEVNKPK